MRAPALIALLTILPLSTASPNPSAYQPFLDPAGNAYIPGLHLLPRQSITSNGGCASTLAPCAALGASVCCRAGTTCTRDNAGNIACCPTNAICTGALSGSLNTQSTPSQTTSGSSNSNGGIIIGGSSTATTSQQNTITAAPTLASGYSTLNNVPYPFLSIPTSYSNAQECLSAFTSCQSASTACFNSLAGVNGVTVGGFGSGVTQSGVSGVLVSSASSICSSLSAVGCYGIQSSQCGSITGGTFVQTTGNAAPARCTGAVYAAAAGVAVAGLFGQLR